jgi:hypothetical protein
MCVPRVQVQYTALPHYEDKYEDFIADTVVLRRRFTPEGERGGVLAWGARPSAAACQLAGAELPAAAPQATTRCCGTATSCLQTRWC